MIEDRPQTPPPPDRLTLAALASIGVPMATMTTPLVVYLPEFYANALGLDLALVGTIFTVIRLLDIAADPILGGLMDRTNTKWGRYRPWLALGAPLLMISVAMLFMAKPGVGPVYLTAWLVGAYAAWSILSLAQLSLSAELSPDYHQRSRIYAWVQGAFVLGILLVLSLPLVLQRGRSDAEETMQIMGWIAIVLAPLAVIFALMRLTSSTAAGERRHAPIWEYFRLFGIRTVQRILGADLLLGIASGLTSAVSVFFFTRALGLPRAMVAVLIIIHMVPALLTAPVWARVAQKIGKHRALVVSTFVYATGQVIYLLALRGGLPVAILAAIVTGCTYSAFTMLPRAMMADVSDEEMLRSGANRTGLFYALLMGTWKVGQAVSVGTAFGVLALMGFDAQQPGAGGAAATRGLFVIYVWLPVTLALLASLAMYRYPMTASRHEEIRLALARVAREGRLRETQP